jgi:serine/threonine-protein kinase
MTPRVLQRKLAAHQLWLADPSQPGAKRANLCSVALACVDLSNQDLRGVIFAWANLKSAILANANLSNADLRGADLSYADFRGARLTGALTRGADLTGAKFE